MVLQYVIPGSCCVLLFNFAMSKKINEKTFLVLSCVISYILLSFISLVRIKFLTMIPDTVMINSGLSIVLGLVLTTLISYLSQHKWFKRLTIKLFHKTLNDDVWRSVLDLDNGSNLKIYLKEKDYYIIGHHKTHEEKGGDSWLALSAFSKRDINTNKPYKNEPSFENNSNIIITIRFSDIEHIEIF